MLVIPIDREAKVHLHVLTTIKTRKTRLGPIAAIIKNQRIVLTNPSLVQADNNSAIVKAGKAPG